VTRATRQCLHMGLINTTPEAQQSFGEEFRYERKCPKIEFRGHRTYFATELGN
jgi:hypothetical protein